jgi:hypothetical protein
VTGEPIRPAQGNPSVRAAVDARTLLVEKIAGDCAEVRAIFGAPAALLSPDVWVYFDVKAVNPGGVKVKGSPTAPCDTMLVKFTKDRADEIQFCESRPVRDFIAQQQQRAATKAKVAAK